jgi:hypothetical protein
LCVCVCVRACVGGCARLCVRVWLGARVYAWSETSTMRWLWPELYARKQLCPTKPLCFCLSFLRRFVKSYGSGSAVYFLKSVPLTKQNIQRRHMIISLTKCKSATTQKLQLGIKNTIVLQYVTTTPDNTGTRVSWQTTCWLPLLLDVVTFVSSVVVLTPNGRCLGCSTVAFSERYTGDVKPLPWPSPTRPISRPKRMDSKTSAIDRSVCLVSSTCRSFDIDIYIDMFVNCNWTDTRWQQYSTHLHTNNT